MASSGKGIDVRGEVVNLLLEKIASDRNPSVTMMNMVEELLAPDDVPAYVGVLMDKVKTDRYPSLAIVNGSYFIACPVVTALSRTLVSASACHRHRPMEAAQGAARSRRRPG
jgi:hypothetical protein